MWIYTSHSTSVFSENIGFPTVSLHLQETNGTILRQLSGKPNAKKYIKQSHNRTDCTPTESQTSYSALDLAGWTEH